MTGFTLQSLSAAAALLVPALGFAALAILLGGAAAEWGAGALLAWTAIAAALLAGAGLSAPAPLPGVAALLGFAALMVGGPPGLALAALAAGTAALPAEGLAAPRWLPLSLAFLAAVVALRRYLG